MLANVCFTVGFDNAVFVRKIHEAAVRLIVLPPEANSIARGRSFQT